MGFWDFAKKAGGVALGGMNSIGLDTELGRDFLTQGGSAQERAQAAANKTNIAEAEKNRLFQEEMSNSAWQRGTTDMIAAGLNPMLAFSQGGASTPGGSQATVQPEEGAAMKGLSKTVLDVVGMANTNSATDKIKSETALTNEATKEKAMSNKIMEQGMPAALKGAEAVQKKKAGSSMVEGWKETASSTARDVGNWLKRTFTSDPTGGVSKEKMNRLKQEVKAFKKRRK